MGVWLLSIKLGTKAACGLKVPKFGTERVLPAEKLSSADIGAPIFPDFPRAFYALASQLSGCCTSSAFTVFFHNYGL